MRDFLKNYKHLPAPMEGIMRPAVMEVCTALELSPVWITPFFRVSETVPKVRELKKFLAPFLPGKNRVVLQIMGNDPAKLAETALRGMEAGACGIDLNCGCPSSQVIRHGSGAAAMLNFENTAGILAAIRQAIGKNFLSVKTRLGFADTVEAEKFLPLWESAGSVDMFTLHYRTAREGYMAIPGREERLTSGRRLLENALVFGNGNIINLAEADDLCRECGLDGTMIGRNFWRNPFMFKDPALSANEGGMILWHELSKLPYGEKHWGQGSAIEMASLILGADSPEAAGLKKSFRQ
ncbi:MAG: tRNA-dihydrouridine synthase family protein [Lentisphaerae bacterium]|nr:tRNA-dihydrouridine synthase family protein [Lentisphaerota bacterium]